MLNKHETPHKFTINKIISCGTETNPSNPIWPLNNASYKPFTQLELKAQQETRKHNMNRMKN